MTQDKIWFDMSDYANYEGVYIGRRADVRGRMTYYVMDNTKHHPNDPDGDGSLVVPGSHTHDLATVLKTARDFKIRELEDHLKRLRA